MRRSARIAAKTSPEAPKGGHKKVAQQGRTPPKRKSLDTSEVTLKKKKLFGQVEEPGEASVNEESDAVETKLDSNGNVQSDSDDSIETSGSEFEDVDTEVSEEFEDPDVETVKKSERPKGKSAKAKEPTVDKEHFAGLRKFTGKGNLMHDAHVSKPKAAPSEQPMANHHFSEGSEDEWEDVDSPSTSKPLVTPAGNLKTAVPKMDVTIVSSEQQKIKERLAKEIQLEINREKKQAALAAHDVILLCNVAHLRLSLKALLSEDACFVTLCRSLIPKGFVESLSKKLDILILKKFMKWFGSSFVTANDKISAEAREKHKLGERMELLVENKCFETSRDLAAILFGCFVSMHILSRFGRAVAFQKEGHDFELVDDDSKKKKKKKSFKECRDYFVEFWSCEEQRWIAVDPKTTLIDCPFKTAECFSPGFLYALAIDNKFGVRDVSARYAEAFLSSSFRRRRTGAEYLKETLRMAIFAANRKRGKAEDMEFHDVLSLRPMPTTLADFKNHPLYALEKDLLKFEAIYPKDEKPLGTVRGHNVYARSAVRRLEGELFWLRQGRCVKKGEEPFKVVKARPDISVPKEEREDRPLPLYGHWQTHDFVPPVVGPNDPVPRNEYDNIYMYKPSMLPKGCVHLKQPGIEKIAKKLQIDHVQAVVGWDFHCGKNHVILEGIVAHTKNEEVLVSAWTEDRIEHLKKVELQTKKRIYGNWRRMITGAIRLNAIRAKFGVTPKLKKKDEEASEETLEEEDVGSQKQWPATDFTLD